MSLFGDSGRMPGRPLLVYVDAAAHLVRPLVLSRLRSYAPWPRHISVSADTAASQLAASAAAVGGDGDCIVIAAVDDRHDSVVAVNQLLTCADAISTLRPRRRLTGIVSVFNRIQLGVAHREVLAREKAHSLDHGLYLALTPAVGGTGAVAHMGAWSGAAVLATALSAKYASRMAPVGGFDRFVDEAHTPLIVAAVDVLLPDWQSLATRAVHAALSDVAFDRGECCISAIEIEKLCLKHIEDVGEIQGSRRQAHSQAALALAYRDKALLDVLDHVARGTANLDSAVVLLRSIAGALEHQSSVWTELLSDVGNALRAEASRFSDIEHDRLLGGKRYAQVTSIAERAVSRFADSGGVALAHLLPPTLAPASIIRRSRDLAKVVDLVAAAIRDALRGGLSEFAAQLHSESTCCISHRRESFTFVPDALACDLRDELWVIPDRAGILDFHVALEQSAA